MLRSAFTMLQSVFMAVKLVVVGLTFKEKLLLIKGAVIGAGAIRLIFKAVAVIIGAKLAKAVFVSAAVIVGKNIVPVSAFAVKAVGLAAKLVVFGLALKKKAVIVKEAAIRGGAAIGLNAMKVAKAVTISAAALTGKALVGAAFEGKHL